LTYDQLIVPLVSEIVMSVQPLEGYLQTSSAWVNVFGGNLHYPLDIGVCDQ